jgi:hypothetical protein
MQSALRTAAQRDIRGAGERPADIYRPRRFNRVSRARFARERIRQLTAHLGRPPSYAERILLDRLVANEWDLRRLDRRLDQGEELSPSSGRLRLALENRLRLDLVALGLRPQPQPQMSLDEHLRMLERDEAAE